MIKWLLITIDIIIFIMIIVLIFQNILFIYSTQIFHIFVTTSLSIPYFIISSLSFLFGVLTTFIVMRYFLKKSKDSYDKDSNIW